MTQLSYKSANELAKMVLDKEISSSELLEYFIKRVESYNPSINAIIVKNYDEARKQARELDEKLLKGEILGGLPLAQEQQAPAPKKKGRAAKQGG